MDINKEYEKLFKQFKKERPSSIKYLTDSTFFELMDWYDEKQNYDSEEENSQDARNFANYVWDKYIEKESKEDKLKEELKIAANKYATDICDKGEENYPSSYNDFGVGYNKALASYTDKNFIAGGLWMLNKLIGHENG